MDELFNSNHSVLPTDYQTLIFVSRYARYLPEKGRREYWNETVDRYINFVCDVQCQGKIPDDIKAELRNAILNLEVMPSMRALMTAGKALERDNVGGFNCSYLAVNRVRAFSEALYILMCGAGVGYSVERQEVNKLPEIPDEIYPSDTTIVFADSRIGWASGIDELFNLLYAGKEPKFDYSKIRAAGKPLKTFGGRACLTGDTVVYKDRKKARGYNEVTLSQLYQMKITGKSDVFPGQPGPAHFDKIKLRSLDEKAGEFYRNQLIDLVDNGLAPVYEIVTESGYRIKATDNHRFMRDTGEYQELSEFSVGDYIAVNGSKEKKTGTCIDCATAISRKAIRCKPCYDKYQQDPDCSETTARMRKECRDALKANCEVCNDDGSQSPLNVHHRDRNPHNNLPDNLETLCESCHRRRHVSEDTFGNPYSHKFLSYDVIVSIRYVGVERVFDLLMEAPNHNFVANGFVSHNSGPDPLRSLCEFVIVKFKQAIGRKFTSEEVHDIMCKIAEVVIVGGVRRSALICLSNLSDDRMRSAKTGQWWISNPQRALANISAVYTERPAIGIFMKEWISLYESKSGERGIFNREAANDQAAKNGRREPYPSFGCNPCSEIILRDRQFCNLSEVVVRSDDTLQTLLDKVEKAAILGTIQATFVNFRYLSKEWKRNTEEESLLGVSLTGIMDNRIMANHAVNGDLHTFIGDVKLTSELSGLAGILETLKNRAVAVNKKWAKILGINPAAAVTCTKPSGTVSQLVNSASGIHARYSEYYIRTIRGDKKDPLSQLMKDSGIPCEDDVLNPNAVSVFSFPMKSPDGAILTENLTALEQLELWLLYQDHWCEHKPSVTINVREHEWMAVGAWVYEHFNKISGISFLPWSDHTYRQAPYQSITEDQYKELVEKMPKEFDWTKLAQYEDGKDYTQATKEFACSAGVCEVTDVGNIKAP